MPKAYLQYMIFDKDMQVQQHGLQVLSTAALNGWQKMHLDVNVQNNGYIYIFVANESMADIAVYFDDMRVQHTESPATSASDYYPFGLTMINRSYTSEPYRFGYQGQFAEYDEETGWNSFEARMYDPVVSRWISVDPARQFASPYVGMGNDPVNGVDSDGRFKTKFGARIYQIFNGGEIINDGNEYAVYNTSWDTDGNGEAILLGDYATTWEDGSRNFAEYMWNRPETRFWVPDFVNIGAGFNGIAGTGGCTNFDLQWVTRGPEASWYPVITVTQAVGVGFSVDATVNVGGTNYLGSVRDIRRSMLQTSIADGQVSYWGGGSLSAGGKLGVEGSYTPTKTGYGLVNRQLIIGVGLPLGPVPFNGAGGVSNTFIIHDFYHE